MVNLCFLSLRRVDITTTSFQTDSGSTFASRIGWSVRIDAGVECEALDEITRDAEDERQIALLDRDPVR